MKKVLKMSLLVFVLIFGLTSCTAESLNDDETVSTNPPKQDIDPPLDPND